MSNWREVLATLPKWEWRLANSVHVHRAGRNDPCPGCLRFTDGEKSVPIPETIIKFKTCKLHYGKVC